MKQGAISLNQAQAFAEDIIEGSRSDVSTRLRAVDSACRSILDSGGQVTISSVRAWLATNRGISIASSSLMNKTLNSKTGLKSHSAARRIIDQYARIHNHNSRAGQNSEISIGANPLISDAELAGIPDHQLRYKIQLLAARARNLQNQLNQVRSIGNLPIISEPYLRQLQHQEFPASDSVDGSHDATLDQAEIDSVMDLVEVRSMLRRGLTFDQNGALKIEVPASQRTRTISISKPFFESAVRKILQLYRANVER